MTLYNTGSHVHDNYLRQMDADEESTAQKRAQAERDCAELYQKWSGMTVRERRDEMMRNPLLQDVEGQKAVYAMWIDEDYESWYSLDEPVGTFEEIEEALSDYETPEPLKPKPTMDELITYLDSFPEELREMKRANGLLTCKR